MTQSTAMNNTTGAPPSHNGFSGYQKFVIALLGLLQFTIILDFMILAPLGAILMPALQITPSQFGSVVSVYAFSAGISGILAAGFADRFDRKKLLLFFYAGFTLGTLFCGLATSYHALLAARMVTGLFGGVIGSIVFAIATDLFPYEMRGRVMGVVQTAFAASQVFGLPFGLFLATRFGWHAPFLMVVAASLVVTGTVWTYLQPIDAHLTLQRQNSFQHLVSTVTNGRYVVAFLTTALLSIGGFMLMPFSSAFSVNNLGITLDRLPIVYMATGAVSIVSGPIIGRLADRIGKFKVFVGGCCLTMCMVEIYTRLGLTPIGIVIAISCLLFIGIGSRMISSSALLSAIPAPESRGAFMSISSSIQQMAGGVASLLAGLIVVQTFEGKIGNFNLVGHVVVGATLTTIVLMYSIHRSIAIQRGPNP